MPLDLGIIEITDFETRAQSLVFYQFSIAYNGSIPMSIEPVQAFSPSEKSTYGVTTISDYQDRIEGIIIYQLRQTPENMTDNEPVQNVAPENDPLLGIVQKQAEYPADKIQKRAPYALS